MGVNTENAFVRSEDGERVADAIAEFDAAAVVGKSSWPLELTVDLSKATRGRKFSISEPRNGWVAVVTASELIEPALAFFLSDRFSTRVAVVQMYEVTGSCGAVVVEQGVAHGGPTRHDVEDPAAETTAFLRGQGIPFNPVLFRETVGSKATGWRIVVVR